MKLNGKKPRKNAAQNLRYPRILTLVSQHLLYSIFSENNAAYFFLNEFFYLAFFQAKKVVKREHFKQSLFVCLK